MEHIVVVAEDIAFPLDEGFKKASAAIANGLASTGKRVTCFTNRDYDGWRRLPSNRLLVSRHLASDLKNLDPDAIIYIPRSAATPMSFVRSRLLRSQSGGKPVVMISLQRRHYPDLLKPMLRRLVPELVLALSSRSAAILKSVGAKVERIPLGVDLEKFRPVSQETRANLRQKYGLPDTKILLHVGHLTRRRNLETFLNLASPSTHLVLVSSTSTRHEVDLLKSSPNLTLIDTYIPSIEEIYQASDIYIFPTFEVKGAIEIPLSILEAMATNLVVMSTPFGGIPDLFGKVRGLKICREPQE